MGLYTHQDYLDYTSSLSPEGQRTDEEIVAFLGELAANPFIRTLTADELAAFTYSLTLHPTFLPWARWLTTKVSAFSRYRDAPHDPAAVADLLAQQRIIWIGDSPIESTDPVRLGRIEFGWSDHWNALIPVVYVWGSDNQFTNPWVNYADSSDSFLVGALKNVAAAIEQIAEEEWPAFAALAAAAYFGAAAVAADGATEAGVVAGEVGGTVGTGSGISAGEAGATGAVVGDAVSDGAADAAGDVAGSAAASSTGIMASITESIASARDFLSGVLGPIGDTLHEVTGVVQSINEGLIQPIVGPIQGIIHAYESLTTQLQRDFSDGFQGLLRVPEDIANALTSVDASMQRSLRVLGVDLTQAISDGYAAAAPLVASAGLAAIRDSLDGPAAALQTKLADPDRVTLRETMDVRMFERDMDFLKDTLEKTPGWISTIGSSIVNALRLTLYAGALHKPFLDAVEDRVNREHPTQELDIGSVLEAWRRGVLSPEQAREEIATHGYSAERIEVMRELGERLTPISDAIRYVQRGLVGENELHETAQQQGFDRTQSELALAASFAPPSFADAITALNHARVAAANIAPASLTEPAPDIMRIVARQAGIGQDAADTAWRAHYATLPGGLVAAAYFRKFITWDQAQAMFAAINLPPELHRDYLNLQRPRIAGRQAITMVRAGILEPGRAHDILTAEGYVPEDVESIIAYGLREGVAPTVEQATALDGLSQSTVLSLYDDRALTRDDAAMLLTQLGLGADSVELTLMLRDLRAQQQERGELRDLIIARVQSGAYTWEEAQSELALAGFTPEEIARTVEMAQRVRATRTKQPPEGSLTHMLLAGIITEDDYFAAMVSAGYPALWADRLLKLALTQKSTQTEGV